MKQLKTFLAALLLLCCSVANAQTFEADGICYTVTSATNKTVGVTNGSNLYTGEVVIPSTVTYEGTEYSVTRIYYGAFRNCRELTKVELPSSITDLGQYAFENCSALTSIVIPDGVTSISDRAFQNCSALTSVVLPNNLTFIGYNAFRNCSSLASIEFPASLTQIENYAFSGCSSLTSLFIPKKAIVVRDDVFYNCGGLTSITVEEGNYSFLSLEGCNALIGRINNGLILGCKNTVIPSSVTNIFANAFYGSSITSITIPSTVTSIGGNAFALCSELTSITVEEGNPVYDSREGCNAIIETASNSIIVGCANTTIPENVTTIKSYAFSGSGISSIEIPNTITTVEYGAFSWSELTSVKICNGVTTIWPGAFIYCQKLANVDIPNSVTTIGNSAFSACDNLATLTIPASVTTIEEGLYMSSLKNVVISEGVTAIWPYAFSGCHNLTNVEIPSSVKSIGESAFNSCMALETIELPNGLESIGRAAFGGAGLINIEIPSSVTSIGNGVFNGCKNLKTISFPAGIKTIGNDMFEGCTSLISFAIPEGVTSVGYGIFANCPSLKEVIIPESVETIGNHLFPGCSNLTSIKSYIPADNLFEADGTFLEFENTNCTLYVPVGAKDTYAATNGWKNFANIVEFEDAKSFDLSVSAAGYATLYLDFNAIIPEGVEVYTANSVEGNKLMMQQVTGVLPANTGVIVRAAEGSYQFVESDESVAAIEGNLLQGSVETIDITPKTNKKYYVLAKKNGVVGMYVDALSGGIFRNNANKAYLVLDMNLDMSDEEVNTKNPGTQLSNKYYFDFSGTTAVEEVVTEGEDNIYYDLSGRAVENPARGIYIVNGKKVLVK